VRIEFTDNIISQNLQKSSPAAQENFDGMQKSGAVRAFTGQLTEAQAKQNSK
jgi:hypothetical protein